MTTNTIRTLAVFAVFTGGLTFDGLQFQNTCIAAELSSPTGALFRNPVYDLTTTNLWLSEDSAFLEIRHMTRKGTDFAVRHKSLLGAVARSGASVLKHCINRDRYYVQIMLPAATAGKRAEIIGQLETDPIVARVISVAAASLEIRDLAQLEVHNDTTTIDGALFRGFRPKRKGFKPNLDAPHAHQIMVKYLEADTSTPADAAAARSRMEQMHRAIGGKVIRTIRDEVQVIDVVELPAGADMAAVLERYLTAPNVEFAEPDYTYRLAAVPNDPRYSSYPMWNLPKISAPAAWDTRNDASSIIVAVIDSGIDDAHPDIAPNMWTNPNVGAGGYNDGTRGYNVALQNGNTADTIGHGTHVAGTIGARGNNAVGTTGVAWNVKLMAVSIAPFASNQQTLASHVADGINYARYKGAKVANLSLAVGASTVVRDQIANFNTNGGVVVFAAGNDSSDITEWNPQAWLSPNQIVVGSSGSTDARDSYSNYGKYSVDLFAPGSNILSTVPLNYPTSDGTPYAAFDGTSMAAPHVAGSLAILKAHFPAEFPRELIDRVRFGVDDIAAFNSSCLSGGRLNLAASFGPRPVLTRGRTTAQVNTGSQIAIGGFVVSGIIPGTKRIAFRALGPSLGGGALPNPQLQVFTSNGQLVASNDNYGSLTSTQLNDLASNGLTPPNALEAAWVGDFIPGTYTVHVSGVGGTTGRATVEGWALDGSTVQRISNASARCYVGGTSTVTEEFAIAGSKPRLVCIRALGPTLAIFGVSPALNDPVIALRNSGGSIIAASDNYSSISEGYTYALGVRLNSAGLQPLNASEAIIMQRLNPGTYSIEVSGAGGSTGITLVEVNEY